MNHIIKPPAILAGALLVLLASATVIPDVRAAEPQKPMALRGVMKKLGQDMQAVTGAISTEDWALVAELAPKIARHDEPPPVEKMRILTWLGSDAGKFRALDGQVHDSATIMGEAATHRDGQGVITAFSKVQQGCLSCHQNFRERFVKHFYERD